MPLGGFADHRAVRSQDHLPHRQRDRLADLDEGAPSLHHLHALVDLLLAAGRCLKAAGFDLAVAAVDLHSAALRQRRTRADDAHAAAAHAARQFTALPVPLCAVAMTHADQQLARRPVEVLDQPHDLGAVAAGGAQVEGVAAAIDDAGRFDEGGQLRQQLLGGAVSERDDLQPLFRRAPHGQRQQNHQEQNAADHRETSQGEKKRHWMPFKHSQPVDAALSATIA